jgi:O-antigen ligase
MRRSTILSWSLALLFALAVAGYPLVSSISLLLGVDNRPISVVYRAFVMGLAGVVIILLGLGQGRLYRGRIWVPLGVFWALYLFRLLLDTALFPVPLRLHPLEYIAYAIGVCLIPMLAFLTWPDPATLRRALRLTVAVAAVAVVTVVLITARSLLGSNMKGLEVGRIATDTLNPISFGHLGVSLALGAMALLLLAGVRSLWWRLVVVAFIGLGLGVAVTASSRGPILALIVGVATLIWAAFQRGHRLKVLVSGLIIMVGGVVGGVALEKRIGFGIFSRIQAIREGGVDQSTSLRLQYTRDAWNLFLDNPVIGGALEEPSSQLYPHNVVIESFMSTGIFGGTAFIIIILASVFGCWRIVQKRREWSWVVALYFQFLVGAQVSGALYTSPGFWSLTAAVISLQASLPRVVRAPGAHGLVPSSARRWKSPPAFDQV